MKPNTLPPLEILQGLFSYNVKTGVGYWKNNRGSVKKGDIVGTRHQGGYLQVGIMGKVYFWHRIIYKLLSTHFDESLCVDHINGDRNDNRPENLRLVTPSENQKNLKLFSTNKSGRVGVFWNKARGKWCASITLENKQVNIGQYKTKSDAIRAREKAENESGFHFNHGRIATKQCYN